MRTLTETLKAAMRDSHATWAASTLYALNATVVPTIENGRHYICTTGGTSGGTQPTWPTTAGQTVSDGSVVWTDNGKRGDALCKLVLTNGTDYTFGVDTTNRLLKVTHPEQPYSQTAKVLVDNYDKNLSNLSPSLEGYQGVISYGFKTSLGDEYSPTAPLKVRAQELLSAGGQLVCQLDLFGIPDQLAKDKALTSYTQESTDNNTVKDLISAIAGKTLTCYSHCTAITVDWGTEDTLIDTFCPKDSFHISVGESRLAKIRELLGWTKCVMRIEDDGQLHIWSPTIEGEVYGYSYNDAIAAANHNFFSKIFRTRLILPNRYVVKNADDPTDVETYYEGEYTSAASYALLPKTEPKILRITSNAQGTSIATALIQRAEIDHERGAGFAPMNCGQEVYDYVNITDSRENDSRAGNIGYLTRNYTPGKFDFFFGFGDILLGASIGLGAPIGFGALQPGEQPYVTYAELQNWYNVLDTNAKNSLTLIDALTTIIEQMMENYTFRKLVVTEELIIPHWS